MKNRLNELLQLFKAEISLNWVYSIYLFVVALVLVFPPFYTSEFLFILFPVLSTWIRSVTLSKNISIKLSRDDFARSVVTSTLVTDLGGFIGFEAIILAAGFIVDIDLNEWQGFIWLMLVFYMALTVVVAVYVFLVAYIVSNLGYSIRKKGGTFKSTTPNELT